MRVFFVSSELHISMPMAEFMRLMEEKKPAKSDHEVLAKAGIAHIPAKPAVGHRSARQIKANRRNAKRSAQVRAQRKNQRPKRSKASIQKMLKTRAATLERKRQEQSQGQAVVVGGSSS